jgi:GR25 family glycosyltransferase involved in LPS biosynthesis
MYLCSGLEKVAVYVINLKERKEKRKYIHTHLNRRGIEYTLFQTTRHTHPKRGCLESHLTIIEKVWKEGKYDKLLLFEDDASFIHSLKSLKRPPADWDMIYFGGTVYRVMEKNVTDGYSRVQCWTTHAYMIHLKNETFMNELLKMKEYEYEIDRYYLEKIHPHYKCYMVDPMICLQKDGFSDIENRMVNYDFMQYTLNGLMVPEHEVDEQKQYILKLPNMLDSELPYVSIVTPTFKRRALFSMAIRNFENFIYPKEKMEWVIVEDVIRDPTDDSYESIEDLLPKDSRIKYISMEVEEPYTVAMKRNIGVSHSSHEYIVHMDDDDYYPPERVMHAVETLLANPKALCAGTSEMHVYFKHIQKMYQFGPYGPMHSTAATFAFRKELLKQTRFDEVSCVAEEKKFLIPQKFFYKNFNSFYLKNLNINGLTDG